MACPWRTSRVILVQSHNTAALFFVVRDVVQKDGLKVCVKSRAFET